PDEETVVLITGTGLKTLEAIADSVETVTIDPTIRSFDEVVTGAPVS
ncbi:MAG: threonine synthase, partial [Chloroflexi bacterium]|nr:threonine synthase [Chloroflexota bacterium]